MTGLVVRRGGEPLLSEPVFILSLADAAAQVMPLGLTGRLGLAACRVRPTAASRRRAERTALRGERAHGCVREPAVGNAGTLRTSAVSAAAS